MLALRIEKSTLHDIAKNFVWPRFPVRRVAEIYTWSLSVYLVCSDSLRISLSKNNGKRLTARLVLPEGNILAPRKQALTSLEPTVINILILMFSPFPCIAKSHVLQIINQGRTS